MFEKALGPDHPHLAASLYNLGEVLRNLADPKGARKIQERALKILRERLGEDHPRTIGMREKLELQENPDSAD